MKGGLDSGKSRHRGKGILPGIPEPLTRDIHKDDPRCRGMFRCNPGLQTIERVSQVRSEHEEGL